MEKIPYYAITVRRYNILFRHTEWFHQTQDLYNEILRAYAKTLVPIQPQVSLPIRIR